MQKWKVEHALASGDEVEVTRLIADMPPLLVFKLALDIAGYERN